MNMVGTQITGKSFSHESLTDRFKAIAAGRGKLAFYAGKSRVESWIGPGMPPYHFGRPERDIR